MDIKDIEYISTSFSDLCGMPIRIYKYEKLVFFHSLVNYPKDPVILNINELLSLNKTIGYITTKDFFYYGIIKHKNYSIIIGPFRPIKPDDSIISKIALELELNKEETETLFTSMSLMNLMPLESVLQSLCMLNFVLNKEKVSTKDIMVDTNTAKELDISIQSKVSDNLMDNLNLEYDNNTYSIEQNLYRIVEHGEIDELRAWIENAPAIRPGIISKDTLRQTKNTFIVAATLASRNAIKGHVDPNEAFALSDLYIQKMETLQNITDIYSLEMNMILDYTERVAKIKGKKNASSFLIDLNKYIIAHLSDAIKIDDICDVLYISKSTLFDRLKKETNMTVSEYILNIKVNESKSLLKYTNKSITAISIYLGFSSQSHFNHVFKKYTNTTPKEYRNSHKEV